MATRTPKSKPVDDAPPAPELIANEQAKALVQSAAIERADRNDEVVPDADRDTVARNSLDAYLREPANMRSLAEQLRGSSVDPEWFARSLVTLVSSNDALQDARPSATDVEAVSAFHRSVLRCALNIAALRLDPSPHFGHVWVLPFKTKQKRRNGKEMEVSLATLIIGYQGYVVLGARVGYEIDGDHIWDGQPFHYNRLRASECSIGVLDRVPEDDEEPRHTWWSATNFLTGNQRVIIQPYGFYLKARNYSQSYRQDLHGLAKAKSGEWRGYKPKSPWSTAPLPMVLKTAVRWNRKLLPLGDASSEDATRWAWAHRIDGGVFAPIGAEGPKKLWTPGGGQLGPAPDELVARDGEPEDGGQLLDVGTADPLPEPEYLPDSFYLGELRSWQGGADVGGYDLTEEVVALVETHGWDSTVAMPVLRGERLDPQLPRALLIAAHALCAAALDGGDEPEADEPE